MDTVDIISVQSYNIVSLTPCECSIMSFLKGVTARIVRVSNCRLNKMTQDGGVTDLNVKVFSYKK